MSEFYQVDSMIYKTYEWNFPNLGEKIPIEKYYLDYFHFYNLHTRDNHSDLSQDRNNPILNNSNLVPVGHILMAFRHLEENRHHIFYQNVH